MPNIKTIRQSFSGGEINRELFGRFDIVKVQNGLATAKNFIILPHGPAVNRPGFQFVRETKTSSKASRLLSFSFSNEQTFCIEAGERYFRFHTLGSTLLAGTVAAYNGATAYVKGDMSSNGGFNYYCKADCTGVAVSNNSYWYQMPSDGVYEIPTDYLSSSLFDVRYTQSGDVVTLTHPSYPPAELKRYGNTRWVIDDVSFASTMAAPASCSIAVTSVTLGTPKDYTYKVTAIGSNGLEESEASPTSATATVDLTITGNYVTVSWASVTDATRYNVYKYSNGSYGFIGQVSGLSIVDDNILADLTRTLPIIEDPFTSAGNYPATSCYYEQRRFFAGTTNQPMNVWSTQSSSDYNMSYSIPAQDSDSIRFKIAANRANAIRHIIPLQDLVLLTASTEWRVSSGNEPLSGPTASIRSQSQNGASKVQPIIVNNFLLYEQAQGGHVREMVYQWDTQGYRSNDISLLATHLFDGYHLIETAFSRAPTPILWAISSSGNLLGLTYVPEQEVSAWHQHSTNGIFESCCTVTEGDRDVLYVIVNRTINGVTKRYVEMFHTRYFENADDAFFVDSGMSYSGTATDKFYGLGHLEGETVSILGDGIVMSQQVVSAGSITIEQAVSKAHIGLPIVADIETLPVFFQDSTFGQAHVKNVNKIWANIKDTGYFHAGPSVDKLTPIKPRNYEPYGSPPNLMSGEIDLFLKSSWFDTGRILIRQSDPLPISIIYLVTECAIGS